MRKRWFLVALLVGSLAALAMVAAACGDDEEEEATATAEGTAEVTATEEAELSVDPNAPVVNAELGDFFITPDVSEIEAGPVTFNASNVGAIPHELVVIRTDLPVDQLPVENGKVDEAAAGEEIGEIEEFEAGLTIAGTFDLAPGKYALICNIAGHYEGGMFTEFTVE